LKDVVPPLQATPTVTLWQRSPVAQSPSAAQYFRQVGPPPAMLTQPVPREHGMVLVEQELPTAPPSAPGWQSTTALLPRQRKSHFWFAKQFCAKGSQDRGVVSGPTSASASLPASTGALALLFPHAEVTSTAAASSSAAAAWRILRKQHMKSRSGAEPITTPMMRPGS
jgi:hypothetical protein